MRDLISLAAAEAQAADLGRIYEWYASRTARAIATSYALVLLAGGAFVKYVGDGHGDFVILLSLGAVSVLAACAGLFQHAELAQLPRELAESTRLLATFRSLTDAGAPEPCRDKESGSAWLI